MSHFLLVFCCFRFFLFGFLANKRSSFASLSTVLADLASGLFVVFRFPFRIRLHFPSDFTPRFRCFSVHHCVYFWRLLCNYLFLGDYLE